ncbi:MAG TPA: hypothetical protein VLT82_11580 [Myxococcaceae bacterium]|nr:hypothetical protein [Myxococcaceae bacterium]
MIVPLLTLALLAAAPPDPLSSPSLVSGLGVRNIGSGRMSGRIAALAARTEKDGKVTMFVGSASGGVWKSTDSGTTFKPVFDRQPVQSIGAVALDPTDRQVIWVGTGESWTRNSVSIGNGIYRSTDGGETWTHLGLESSERIARILVHPKNGRVVYACVPGKLWSDSADRGLYKTTDGGAHWTLVLRGPNLSTGCGAVAMDPRKPDRLFAGLWDFRRKGWTFRSGGENATAPSGSGLFVTEDGGAHWKQLDAGSAKGLPKGPWGRLALAIAPSDPRIVYAFIEGTRSALFRSSDGGRTWEERDRSQMMVWRPFYFANLIVDPKNPDRVFKPDGALIASEDGGKSFANVSGRTHGDHHDLWIDPTNTQHVVSGDDGGLWISHDGGNTWWKVDTLPVAQFYHLSVDDRDPYQVFGGLQDNSTWVGKSAYPGGITSSEWENVANSDGFWAFPDPSDPDTIYAEAQGGFVMRVDRRTLVGRDIQPKAGFKEKLRWNWNTPIHISPHEKSTLYIGAQFLFRSADRGFTWERISPDLTTNDPQKQKQEESGGVTVDNSAAEMHTTLYAISESPKARGLLWVGTDDGNIQLSRDGGKSWRSVGGVLPGAPEGRWISYLSAGRFAECTAYATVDRHSYGDMAPYAYRTLDCGERWERVAAPEQGIVGYAHVLKEDTVDPNLLFLGTELGLWISVDRGRHWARFQPDNFPAVAVRDLVVQERDGDLVLGTHGRGIWILDDLSPLRGLGTRTLDQPVTFLPSRPLQQRLESNGGWANGDAAYVGANPAQGAVITYYRQKRHVFGRMKLEVLDAAGRVVDSLPAGKRPGMNRVVWSMHVEPPKVPTGAQLAWSSFSSPRVVPGRYRIRLTEGEQVHETTLEVTLDRRVPYTVADRKAQYEAAMAAHALFGRMSAVVEQLNGIRTLATERAAALGDDPLAARLRSLSEKADGLRKQVVATKEGGAITGEERLREHLDFVYRALLSDEGKPSPYQMERVATLGRELDEVGAGTDALLRTDLGPLNQELQKRGLKPITPQLAQQTGARWAAAQELLRAQDRAASATTTRGERD